MRNPLRMTCRIGDRRHGAFRATHQRKSIETERVNHRLEIANERIDGKVGIVPIRKTVAALVVVNEGVILGKLFGPVSPNRAFPAEGDMAKPVRRPHQRRAVANGGIRNPNAVRRPAELNFVRSGSSELPLCFGGASDRAINHSHLRCGLKRRLGRPAQRSACNHVKFVKFCRCASELLICVAHAAAGARQSAKGGAGGLVGRIEGAQHPRVRRGLIRQIFKARNQCGEKTHAKPSHLFALRGTPILKLLTLRQIETFEKVLLKRRRSFAQRFCRDRACPVPDKVTYRHDIYRDMIRLDPNLIRSAMILVKAGSSTSGRRRVKLQRRAARGSSGTGHNMAHSRARLCGRAVTTR